MTSQSGSRPGDCVVLPQGAPLALREFVKAAEGRSVRIAYVTGPGDVLGTHGHWARDEHDPRVPVVTYSGMFYALVEKLDADALVLHQAGEAGTQRRGRFTFTRVVRTPPRRGAIAHRISEWQFARRLHDALRAYGPDIILLASDTPLALLRRLPRGARVILSAHNSYWPMGRQPRGLRQRIRLWVAARALRRVDAAVCTSPECRRQLALLRGSSHGLFVEMPQLPAPLPPPHPTGQSLQSLLFAGRVEQDKGVFDLLRVFERLAASHGGLSLEFAGEGSALEALRAAVQASGFASRVRVLGRLPAEALRERMRHADLLLCPTRSSFNEGLALVVLESAALGTPAIASSVVPAVEVVGDACLTFEADDAGALAQALENLLADPQRYQRMRSATEGVGRRMLLRERSWGSCLGLAMLGRSGSQEGAHDAV